MSITVYDYDSKQSLEDLVIMNQSKNQEKCYKFDLTFFNKHEHKDESLLGPIDGIKDICMELLNNNPTFKGVLIYAGGDYEKVMLKANGQFRIIDVNDNINPEDKRLLNKYIKKKDRKFK